MLQKTVQTARRFWLPAIVCAGLLCMLTINALAANSAQLRPDMTILIDGVEQTFYNVNGQEVHPILCDGTTYLPVRAIGEVMGKNVDWNQTTKTITLAGARTTASTAGTPDDSAKVQNVIVDIRSDFTIVVDGSTQTFKDASGDRVYPMLYNGSTYLPLRAVGELMGKTVSWDGETNTVTLTSRTTVPTVTDADSFSDGTAPAGPDTAGLITAADAKTAALNHANLTAGQVTFTKQKLTWEDGRQVYDIEFYTSDYKEYDYEIDAKTGTVLSFDYDTDSSGTTPAGPDTTGLITAEDAKTAALNHANLTAGQVTFTKQKLTWEDGRQVYDIEFYTSDYKEYDYEIDAKTGAVLSFDYDADSFTPPSTTNGTITRDKAQEIALAKVPGATVRNVKKIKADHDDGKLIYEIEIVYNEMEYDFEIDAATGTILEMDSESIHD